MQLASPVLQALFYNNPDGYPPIINSTQLLAEAGFCVDILCRQYGQEWGIRYPTNATIRRIDGRGMSSLRGYVHYVAHVLRRARPDSTVFVGHDMHGFLPARLLAARYRRPLVYHCHDFAESSATVGGRLVKGFEQRFARTADLVIVPDRERGEVMARALHLPQPPQIVANAPLAAATAAGERLRYALAELGYNWSRILFRQGRIGPGHAIESTLRSLPLWRDRAWGFAVMGFGDPDYLDHLSGMAQELAVERQFAILPPVAYDQVLEFTPGADAGHALYEPIHVNNQYITTASNKIMEYMAAGLPILTSARPALRYFVESHGCGVVADEGSAETIAAVVNQLFAQPAWCRAMGQAGQRAFCSTYSYPIQFAPVLDVLKQWTN